VNPTEAQWVELLFESLQRIFAEVALRGGDDMHQLAFGLKAMISAGSNR